MNWWRNFFGHQQHKHSEDDKSALILEIRKAQQEWIHAQSRLDYVIEKDEIDFSIYALEAAEIRYGILLREAKRSGISLHREVVQHAHAAESVQQSGD